MADTSKEINIIELLMGIKEDVSSIKTDMANFKETQRTEKNMILKELQDVRSDCQRDMSDLESRVMGKINSIQSVQNNLVGDVDTLKNADDKKDATRWRATVAYILTALGGMVFARIPDCIAFILRVKGE